MNEERECSTARPARGDGECDGPPRFDIVVRVDGKEFGARRATCFHHGLAEVDRSDAAGSIAVTEMVEAE